MAFNQFPYSNFHELNADWMLQQIKSAADRVEVALAVIDGVETQITALQNVDAQLRQEIAAINASLSQMGTVLSRHTSEITALQQADASLEGDLQDVRTELTNTLQRLDDVEASVYAGLWPALAEQYTAYQAYNVGDIVYATASGDTAPKIWRCVTAHTGPVTFDPTKWQAVTVADMIGLLRQTMADNITEEFSPSTLYQVNDYVMHEGVLYKRVGTAGSGAWNTNSWDPVSIMPEMVELREQVDDVSPFVVTFTHTPDGNTCDKSFQDIQNAINAGRQVIAYIIDTELSSASNPWKACMPSFLKTANSITFCGGYVSFDDTPSIHGGMWWTIEIYTNGINYHVLEY